jgi:hypothetical protein
MGVFELEFIFEQFNKRDFAGEFSNIGVFCGEET